MSEAQYIDIRRFIVRYIQDQDFAENDGVPGRVLFQLCLERFYPDLDTPEAVRTEKKSIEGVKRRMVEDSMLQHVTKNQKVVFRLAPFFNIKDKMNATASQPSEDPQSTQEALQALEKETSPDMEEQDVGQQDDDDDLEQQLAQQLDESMHQMEDEAEAEMDMQAEVRQSGWVQKPIFSELEEQEQGREEEVTHDGEIEDQQHAADEDTEITVETQQVNETTEAVESGMTRQREAQEAARIEVTSEQAADQPQYSMLMIARAQDMQKLTPRLQEGQLPCHMKQKMGKKRKTKIQSEHLGGSVEDCWRLRRAMRRAAWIR